MISLLLLFFPQFFDYFRCYDEYVLMSPQLEIKSTAANKRECTLAPLSAGNSVNGALRLLWLWFRRNSMWRHATCVALASIARSSVICCTLYLSIDTIFENPLCRFYEHIGASFFVFFLQLYDYYYYYLCFFIATIFIFNH